VFIIITSICISAVDCACVFIYIANYRQIIIGQLFDAICDVSEHWNNQYNLSDILPNPEDWPTHKAAVSCFRGPFNVRSFFSHIFSMLSLAW